MANTYTQIHLHIIFGVKNRQSLIKAAWKEELNRYLTGAVQNNTHKLIAINGMPDHMHLLIGYRPVQAVSELVKDIKSNSSRWINEKRFIKDKFEWQEGFGAFSYSKSQINNVVNYINNQEEIHKKTSFRQEYIDFLKIFEVDFDERYVFKDVY